MSNDLMMKPDTHLKVADEYRKLGKRANDQAESLGQIVQALARMADEVSKTIGGTASRGDQDMILLLNETSRHTASAAKVLRDAKQMADKAAAKAEHDHRQQAKRNQRPR
jgi:methyl-accepting chemotaxis protein